MKSKAIVKICICGIIALALIGALVWLIFFGGSIPFGLSFGNFYSDAESYSVGEDTVTDEVNRVEIYWTSGEVNVSAYEGTEIRISEQGAKDEDSRLRWRLENGVLTIRYAKSGMMINTYDKALTLELPAALLQQMKIEVASAATTLDGIQANTLLYDAASGDLWANDCSFDRVEIDGASAMCSMERCSIGSFDMDAASGAAKLDGSFEEVSFQAASGNLRLVSDTAPHRIETDTASGDVDITIPADAGFHAEHDAASGDFNVVGFMGNYMEDEFSCGDSSGDYSFDTASGDVTIRAAS